MKYAQPIGGAANDSYVDANPGAGIEGSAVPAAAIEQPQREIEAVIVGEGLAAVPGDLTQLRQSIRKMVQTQSANSFTTAGAAPNFTGVPPQEITAYAAGQRFRVKFHAVGSGANQLNICALGNKTLKQYDSTGAKVAAVIAANQLVDVEYDGVDMLLLDPLPVAVSSAGEICFFTRNTAPPGFLKANGALLSRTSYASLFAALVKTSVATITIATPGVVTWNSHGLSANDPVKFTTTGALPTGLIAGTTYYVVGASITANTFQLSVTAGAAAIATSGAQSGVQTAINAPFGDGDGSTTFGLPDARGEFLRGWDDGRGVDSGRAFGSAQADELKAHLHTAVEWRATGFDNTGGPYPVMADAAGAAGLRQNLTENTGGTETRSRNLALLACIKYQ